MGKFRNENSFVHKNFIFVCYLIYVEDIIGVLVVIRAGIGDIFWMEFKTPFVAPKDTKKV